MDRRKELKEIYKNTKHDMGVFIIQTKRVNKCHIEGTMDLKSAMNSARFKLDLGNYHNKELQKEWDKDGASDFVIEVLEMLKHDKDESKVDYNEELNILKIIWQDKLSDRGLEFYKK